MDVWDDLYSGDTFPSPIGEVVSYIMLIKEEKDDLRRKFPSPIGEVVSYIYDPVLKFERMLNSFRPLSGK